MASISTENLLEIFQLEKSLSKELMGWACRHVEQAPAVSSGGVPDLEATVNYFVRLCAVAVRLQEEALPTYKRRHMVKEDRLREIFIFCFSLAEPGVHQPDLPYFFSDALAKAQARAWLQVEKEEEWHPGMPSGTGWVNYYKLSLIGKRMAALPDDQKKEEDTTRYQSSEPERPPEEVSGKVPGDKEKLPPRPKGVSQVVHQNLWWFVEREFRGDWFRRRDIEDTMNLRQQPSLTMIKEWLKGMREFGYLESKGNMTYRIYRIKPEYLP